MTTTVAPELESLMQLLGSRPLPDHLSLPDSDGAIVQNFQEHPQSILLTDAIRPVLQHVHPDEQYCIGQDCGIYWNLQLSLSEEPLRSAIAPDWFYVPNVPPLLDGKIRRSYVMWQEWIGPLVVIEFVSGDGAQERNRTPVTGKFWIYEQVIRPAFYAIYEVDPGRVELYHLNEGRFQPVPADAWGNYPLAPLHVSLGIWHGRFQNAALPWLRWYDDQGNLLPTSEERAESEHQRAESEHQRAESERQRAESEHQRAERLAARLRALGIDPDAA